MAYTSIEQKRKYQREWRRARRVKWLLQNGPCKRCGGWENLHVDHVDASTKVTNSVWNWAESRRLQELAKCQVLCFECHRKKTTENDERRYPQLKFDDETHHGRPWMYQKYRCRCEKCREWKRLSDMKYKNPKKYNSLMTRTETEPLMGAGLVANQKCTH